MKNKTMIRATAAATLLAATLTSGAAMAQAFSFGLWGDMPYEKNNDAARTQAVVESINRSDIAFSLYDGDIKDGSSHCTDETFVRIKRWFNAMKAPVVYVPGDNEWTDCHRTNNGGFKPVERLEVLRRTMFDTPHSLGQRKLRLTLQGEPGGKFSENTRFVHGGIVFVGLNVPGSDNSYVANEKSCTAKSVRTWADCEAGNAEYRERDAANIRWLQESFEQARQRKAKGIVLVFQGDPGFDLPETEDVDEAKTRGWNRPESGYHAFMRAIIAQTEAFAGQVLLVHGDTHVFKVDKPLYAPLNLLPNLTRLQTFGSPNNHWVRVSVDTRTKEVFTIRPVMVDAK